MKSTVKPTPHQPPASLYAVMASEQHMKADKMSNSSPADVTATQVSEPMFLSAGVGVGLRCDLRPSLTRSWLTTRRNEFDMIAIADMPRATAKRSHDPTMRFREACWEKV
jgi:hypothetical protein